MKAEKTKLQPGSCVDYIILITSKPSYLFVLLRTVDFRPVFVFC